MDATVSSAGACRDHGPSMGSEAINPFAGCDGLACRIVGPQRCPVAFVLIVLVWNRALYDQNERVNTALGSQVKARQKFITVLKGKKWIQQSDLWDPWQYSVQEILDARLRGRGHCYGVPVAAKP